MEGTQEENSNIKKFICIVKLVNFHRDSNCRSLISKTKTVFITCGLHSYMMLRRDH